jgi:predicted ester cyclase
MYTENFHHKLQKERYMSQENKSISRDLIDGLWNRRDMSVADKYIDPDMAPEGPFSDQFPPGPEGLKTFASTFINAFPDLECSIDNQETDGDMVRTWVTFVGTQTGQLMDIPPTGNEVTVEVVVTDRISGGKIVESSSEWDPDDMMRQLGIG